MFARPDLEAARAAGVIDQPTLDRLIGFLAGREPAVPPVPVSAIVARFDLSHLLWYAGALIIMGSMGLFSTLAFSLMGGAALTTTAVVYALGFLYAGHIVWYRRDLPTPGGLLIACAVAMAPLAVYGIQEWAGWWQDGVRPGSLRDFHIWIKGGWVPMEIVTIVAALVALRFYPFPFIVAVMAVAVWFLTMDIAELYVSTIRDGSFSYYGLRREITMWFGLAVIVVAWIVDLKPRRGDFAFWLHLAGIAAFWGAVTASSSSSELGKLVYCLLNVGLIGLAVFLMRRVYAVFGAIGVMFYLGYLATSLFKNSLLFPFALSGLGLLLIVAGIRYFKNRARIQAALDERLPEGLKRLRPAHARMG